MGAQPQKLSRRKRTFERGLRAEQAAVWLLRLKGYRILATRWRCPQGEIDLIALRGHTFCFIEVKARPNETESAHAITPHQCARIQQASLAFMAAQSALPQEYRMRYDAIFCLPGKLPRHLPDAWRP